MILRPLFQWRPLRTGNLAILKGAMNEKYTNTTGIIYETAPISSA